MDNSLEKICLTSPMSEPIIDSLSISDALTFSVTDLCSKIKGKVSTLRNITVQGEISNWNVTQFNNYTKNYLFFGIKDNCAKISVAMTRADLLKSLGQESATIKDGSKVQLKGSVNFKIETGGITFWATKIVLLSGIGFLYQEFEKNKRILIDNGFTDPSRKLPLPSFISNVGVITSSTGQAVKDIIQTIKRRNPFINIYIFEAIVQGSDAEISLKRAFYHTLLYREKLGLDVVIIARGGGSFEELNAFNNINFVGYVAQYRSCPIISGVGHEGDFTLIDYVADYRASTPTAAAETVSNNIKELFDRLSSAKARYPKVMNNNINNYRNKLSIYNQNYSRLIENIIYDKSNLLQSLYNKFITLNPVVKLNKQKQEVLLLKHNLEQKMVVYFNGIRDILSDYNERFQNQSPLPLIQQYNLKLEYCNNNLSKFMNNYLEKNKQRIGELASLLDAKSPLKVLARGYSITTDNTGKIMNASLLAVGDKIKTRFSDGEIESVVTKIDENY